MKKYTVAVIGGTGKSGKYLVQHLLDHGYSVKLLVRNPETVILSNPLAEIVKGDARDYQSVIKTVENTDLVISTLGQPKGEPPIFSDATKNVMKAMNVCGLKRYIVTTGLSVNTPSDRKNEKVQLATGWMYQNYPETTHDKQKEYELLTESNLDWTLMRLPLIDLTNESRITEASLEDCQGENISATDLAGFLIAQIDDRTFIKKSPFLYNR
ncbi:NAD(P)H-binding protein [Chryseobacterium fluminis]|uniref:NAD(P)-dependent oxidoreductase n=1 Tax=Chryseobacterium fluminis TaxID=2983606 RepID=UPI00225ACC0D|nr:NAD(P)H-binding protein [Chryseobacterium sp. MMS21-Ot14]UZT98260.1 NAD(P)H-binding protein [Chryseobacterium sp. MMS21-Ot14]